MKKLPKIFIVEDDQFYANLLENEIVKNKAGKVEVYNSGEKFLESLFKSPDVVLLDHHLGTMLGIEVLKEIKAFNPNIQVIFLSAQEKLQVAIDSLKYGAYDYVEKNDSTFTRIILSIKRIGKFNQMVEENKYHKVVKVALAITLGAIISFALYIQLLDSTSLFQ